ncbi:hypothetical protein Q9L58_001557 [Maublancomyces gigas]|uniref:Distal membrane-arm assembly complex protein 1-like domain-containing protein n=1 Tax=Discina gigas TaxID=1032678 RepID=A0ABR3GTS2_9PEZI
MSSGPSKPIFDVEIPLSKVLDEEMKEDCRSCKVIGTAAPIGVAAYIFMSGRTQLRKQEEAIMRANTRWGIGARRLGIYGITASLVGMGVYRAIM